MQSVGFVITRAVLYGVSIVERVGRDLDGTPPADAPSRVRDERLPVVGHAERVTVTGISGSKEVLARIDTAASMTRIAPDLAADLGTEPSAAVEDGAPPQVDIVVELAGERRTVTAVLDEEMEPETPLRIGRNVLRDYYVDVRRGVRGDTGD